MRKRIALLGTTFAIALALILPGAASAATLGQIKMVSGYCSGDNTVHATFKVVKYSGYYASKLTITAKGQGYHNGKWQTEKTLGTATKWVYTSGKATLQATFKFNPGHSGRHRIHVVAKAWNGKVVVAKGSLNSGYCV